MKANALVEKMTSGQLGLKSNDSILTLIGTDDKDAQVSENLFAALPVNAVPRT